MANEGAKGRISPVHEAQLLRAAACDWRLSRGDVGVFAVILAHCDDAWLSFPGPSLISRDARLAMSNVKASLARLEALKYIRIKRPGPRKANRYVALESPNVPSQKVQRILKDARKLGLPAGPDWSAKESPTRPAHRLATRPAGSQQLGLPAGHESSSEITYESSCASRRFPSPEELEQQRREREERHRDGFRREYQEALVTPGLQWARRMEQNPAIRKYIEDLIPERHKAA